MGDANDRLRETREKAGFKSARSAALRFHWNPSTYASHENGQTPNIPARAAAKYARAFKTTAAYILTGEGAKTARTVPIVGRVGAGAQATLYAEGHAPAGEDVPAPPGATTRTVAVEIQGDSLGAVFDGWIAFYDKRNDPPTEDMLGKLCVVGLDDGRILVKKLAKDRARGRYVLWSDKAEPIMGAKVQWAAPVTALSPRRWERGSP